MHSRKQAQEFDYVRRAKTGDEAAFLYLYDLWVDKLYMFCYLQTDDQETSETICAKVFNNAWVGISSLQNGEPFYAWLFRIARAELATHKTKRRVLTDETEELYDDPDDQIRKLAALPPIYREVIILKTVTGFNSAEIAATLRISENEVQQLQTKALTILAAQEAVEQEASEAEINAKTKLNYVLTRIGLMYAKSHELEAQRLESYVANIENYEEHWEDLTERVRQMEKSALGDWVEVNRSLDSLLTKVNSQLP